MSLRGRLTAVLLLVALAAAPQWLWLGAHVLEHHEHAAEHTAGLAEALIHGHGHEEGVPDHAHRLVPSPTFRPDPPQDLVTATASLESPQAGQPALSGAASWQSGTCLSGSSPPRLHLLCTLLI